MTTPWPALQLPRRCETRVGVLRRVKNRVDLDQHGDQRFSASAHPFIRIPDQRLAHPHCGIAVGGQHAEYVEDRCVNPIRGCRRGENPRLTAALCRVTPVTVISSTVADMASEAQALSPSAYLA